MSDESIEDYESSDLSVVEVRQYEVVVDAGDSKASINAAIRFEDQSIGRVVEILGTRRLLVQRFSTDGIQEGQSIEVLDGQAGLDAPTRGSHRVGDLRFVVEGIPLDPPSPRLREIDASRLPIETGHEVRDTVAPLSEGGVNLVINESAETVLDELVAHIEVSVSIRVGGEADITLEYEDEWQHLMAMRVGAAWADNARRDGKNVAFLARLPTPRFDATQAAGKGPSDSIADLVNELGRILVSTETARITTFLEVDVARSAVADIAETMGFGDVDTQWFLDAEGRFDPRRSTSSAEVDSKVHRARREILRRLDVAKKARERAEIFGEFELSDEEREALEFADTVAD